MLRYDDKIYEDKCRSCEPSDHRKSYKALNDLNEEIICCNNKAVNWKCRGLEPEQCQKKLCRNCAMGEEKSKYCAECWFLLTFEEGIDSTRPAPQEEDNDVVETSTKSRATTRTKNTTEIRATLEDDESEFIRSRKDQVFNVKDGDDISDEHLAQLQAQAYELMKESEEIIKNKVDTSGKKLPLISLWEMPICGGHHVFGTIHCCSLPWWVVHAQLIKWEDDGIDKTTRKNNISALITKFCFCVCGTKYDGNMSLIAEFLPDVLSINPYVKGDVTVVDNRLAKAENLSDKWDRLSKISFTKANSMLRYYAPVQSNNLKVHVDKVLCYFNRVYRNPKVCNHRWGYSSDPELIQLLIQLLTKVPEITGNKFSLKNKVDEKLANHFNVGEVDGLLQSEMFERKDIKEIMEVYPEYFSNIHVSRSSDGSSTANEDAVMRVLKEIYTNNCMRDLRKEVRRQEHQKKER